MTSKNRMRLGTALAVCLLGGIATPVAAQDFGSFSYDFTFTQEQLDAIQAYINANTTPTLAPPPPPPPSISPVIVAGGTTSLDITAQGTPIINIAAPRADGTSYNVFSKLNVGAEGTIFNNRTTPGASQLGGTIVANPNIASTGMAATLILNEVTSGTRSDLLGTLEVAGAKAGLIIANPAGVTCDGCGFVNVSRATLSTGSPVFGASGAFTGLNVVGGQVVVQGQGLSGTAPDYFDIVAGSTNVNAAINARDLLIAGAGQFGYADRNIIVVNAAPNLTIDSSLLGGIYANRIRIVGTSAGVGVNLQGLVQAYGGPISISAQGAVNLNNVTGAGDVAVQSEASTVKLSGTLNAGGAAFITAKDDITFSNSIVTANAVFLDAGRNINIGTKTEPLALTYDLGYDPSREDLYYNGYAYGYGTNAALTTFNPYTYTNTTPIITTAKITATNIVSAYAGQNLTVNAGSSIKATNIGLTADNDVSILAESNLKSTSVRTNISGSYGYYGGAYGTKYYDQTITSEADVTGAEVNASGSLIFDAGRDINLIAALVNAGSNASLFAGRDLVVGGLGSSKVLQRTYALNSSISGSSTEAFEEYDATSLSAGGNLTLRSGQELEITGASVNAGGNLTGIAVYGTAYVSGADVSALGNLYVSGNSAKIIGSINNNSFDETVRKVKRGFLSKKTTTTVTSNAVQTVFASNLSGNNINLLSNTDVSILDANVAANNSVDIAAGGDIGIGSVTTDSSYYSSTKIKKSGFSFGGGGFFLGVSKSTNNVTTDVLSNAGSLIGAAEGTVRISAGAFGAGNGDLGIAGSRIAALENVVLAGDTVKIFNNIDSTTTATFFKSSSFGITRSFGSNLVNSANTIAALAKTASKTSNNRVQAVSLLAAGLAVKNGYDAAKQVVQSIKSGTGDLGITESISLGFNKTTASSLTIDENAVASQVVGGDIVILARGGVGQTGVSILGSDVTATRNLNIFSNSDVIIGAGTENDVFSGNSSSFGVSLGVSSSLSLTNGSVGFTPPTVSLGFNSSKSSYYGRDVTARPTILGAGAKATIDTLGTLLLEGSQLAANKVEVNAGSLNIISLQNTSDYISRSRNFGINITYNGSFGVNGSYGSTNYTGTFKAVQDLAGIRAGAGGFDLDVVGNTFLNGGVIASTAAVSLNRLATGSLIARNINNYENYKASTVSFSASLGGGSTTGVSLGSLGNLNASIPTALSASGSQFSTTYSAVSPATVLLRGGDAASAAALAGLSRDTSLAFSPLTKEFTEAAREEIQQGFDATRQLVTETATFFANRATEEKKLRAEVAAKEKIAIDANGVVRDANGNPLRDEFGHLIPLSGNQIAIDALAQAKLARNAANNLNTTYGSGSAARILATAITGAAGGNVTGSISSFARAALVNAVQSLTVNEIKKIADSLGQRDANGNLIRQNGQIVATVESEALRTALQALAACGGSAAGGSSSCSSAVLGSTASITLNLLLDAIDKRDRTVDITRDGQGDTFTLENEQARTNLIATLAGILASSVGENASAAVLASTIEIENNQLGGLSFNGSCGPSVPGCRAIAKEDYAKLATIVRVDDQGRAFDANGIQVDVRFVTGAPVDLNFLRNSLPDYQRSYRVALDVAIRALNPGYISQDTYDAAMNASIMAGTFPPFFSPTPNGTVLQPTPNQVLFILSASEGANFTTPSQVNDFLQYYGGLLNITTSQAPTYYGSQLALAYTEDKAAFERVGQNRLVGLDNPNNISEFLKLPPAEYIELQQAYNYAARTGQLPRALSTADRVNSGIDAVGNFAVAGLLAFGAVGTAPACATIAGCLVPIGFGAGAGVTLDSAITSFNQARTGYSQQTTGGYLSTRIFRVNASTGEIIYLGTQIVGGGAVAGGRALLSSRTTTVGNVVTRSLDDLAPNGRIPTISSGNFESWYDNLSPEEFQLLWSNPSTRRLIEDRLRSPGGLHEWCMVCRAPTFKTWGVPASEIHRFRTRTEDLTWTVPGTGLPGRHGGAGSTQFHNELSGLIDSSNSLDDFNRKLPELLRRWQINPNSLPPLPRGT